MKTLQNLALLVFLVLLWGASWPINKVGLNYTSPMTFNTLRLSIGTIVMFLLCLSTKNLVWPKVRDLPVITIVSFFQIGLIMSLSIFGLAIIDAGRASFILFTTSIWLIPLGALLHKKIHPIEIVSLVLGILGVICIISPWQTNGYGENQWLGYLILLFSSFFWSIGILAARNMKWHHPPIKLLPWQLLFSTLLTLLLAIAEGDPLIPQTFPNTLLWSLLYSGIGVIGFGYWLMFIASKKLPSGIVSLGLIWVPIIALGISWYFLGESISLFLLCGIFLVIVGVLVHIYIDRKLKQKEKPFKEVP